jgi:hypothetical protein
MKKEFPRAGHILLLVRERYPTIRVRYLNHGTGFDLVGDENEYRPLTYYIPKLLCQCQVVPQLTERGRC